MSRRNICHLLIDLSPQTDDRLRYCTNTGSIPSKFCIPDWLKQSKYLNDKHTKSIYSPIVAIIFPQIQKSFPSVWPIRVYRVPTRKYSESSRRTPAKYKKTARDKISKQSSIVFSENNHLGAKKRHSGIRTRFRTHKSHYSSRH